jgi:TolB-like protein
MSPTKNPARLASHGAPVRCVSIRDSSISESLCRAHLDKVAGSATFGRAQQLRNLLEWLANRSLAAPQIAPLEKEIAAAVLGRKDFDPLTDSIVRKEMGRLREKLSQYYLAEGPQDEIRIVAGGGYLLGFEWRGNASPASGRPCWLVLPFRSNAQTEAHVEQLLEELLICLGERGEIELLAPTTALAYRGRSGDVRQFAAECCADFVVEGALRIQDELIEAKAWLVDGQSGRSRRFKRISGSDVVGIARLATAWLLEEDPTLGHE